MNLPESLSNIVPIWLRDVYATVQSQPLYFLEGPMIESPQSEEAVKFALTQKLESSNLFLSGDNIFCYLNKNMTSNMCDHYITVVIHNLPDLYWSNKENIFDETLEIDLAIKQPFPTFKDINEYRSVNQLINQSNPLVLYQLLGTISPYNVLHIPIRYFIESLNNKRPINISLDRIDTIIQLNYEQFDFWDPITNSLIESIDLSSYCSY